MSTGLFGILTSYDHNGQDWKTYKCRLTQWFVANDITSATDTSGTKRRAILLSALTEGTYRLAADLALPKDLQVVPYDDIIQALDKHFNPTRVGFSERHNFYASVQQQGETHSQWAARLRGLTSLCAFNNVEEALRDRFIMGMRTCPEKEKLYAHDLVGLTLGKAVEYAENVNSARAAAAASASGAGASAAAPDSLYKISRNAKGSAASKSDRVGKPKCSVCGYTNHKTPECQYSDYVCRKCNVKGHLRRMCPSKVNYVDNGAGDEDFGDDGEQAREPESSRTEPFVRRLGSGMAGIISKLKSVSNQAPPPLESNPIMQYFEIGKESSNAGPGLVWRVHDAYRKSDGKQCSVFIFDKRIAEKLYKPKRKESMLDRIRACVAQLEKLRHPKMLQIIHTLEEGHNTIAFASEHVLASLHNILAWHESSAVPPGAQPPVLPHPASLGPPGMQNPQVNTAPQRPPYAREYFFLDIELRYGLLQIIEALHYLHYTARQIHRNVCPQVIIVTKRGTWKLFGLEFIENILGPDPTEMLTVAPWSIKVAKIAQPNLDYLAPEIQTNGNCNILSDMFSLGLVICAVFNSGKPLIQANNNPMLYVKQIEFLDEQVSAVLPRVPAALQEAVQRLLSRDPHPRPTTQLLPLIKYFKCQSEVAIQAMQFLDVITMKDPNQKTNFYRITLIDALPYIPKKLRWQHVWPALQLEVRTAEVLAAVLQPIIWLTNEATPDEFSHYVLPTLKNLMNSPKSVQASVTILENLHIILKKCKKEEVNNEIMPLLYTALDNNTNQIQTASLIAMQNVSDYIEDKALHGIVLGKVKVLLEKNQSDVKIISLILGFYEKILLRLERNHILEQVIPTLLSMRLSDPDIINRVVRLYKSMLLERKFGLTTNVMATKMIPSLAPQTVNPALNVDQFTNLMEILYDMLDNIDKNQRYKLKLDSLSLHSPERHRPLRHQMSTDNMNVPPFNIPNLRVEQRKTSSAEDMARKNSIGAQSVGTGSVGGGFKSSGIGQWFFGSSNSTNADNNFLRVASAFPNRRLSDNTLMTPKIRIAPSCASSPGGTPGGNSGLPTRRHSSIGPQERRGSAVNLSPPTGYQYRGRGGSGSSLSVPSASQCVGGSMPNTSSSVPFLLTSSMQSIRSRRPSACLSGSQGSGILQQLSSGMVRHMPVGSSSSVHSKMPTHWGTLQGATSAGYNALQHTAIAVRKCPSLNITLTR